MMEHDKILHFFLGMIVTAISYPLLSYYALLIGCAIAVAKEIYDLYDDKTKKDVELLDMTATILGSLIATITLTIIS